MPSDNTPSTSNSYSSNVFYDSLHKGRMILCQVTSICDGRGERYERQRLVTLAAIWIASKDS